MYKLITFDVYSALMDFFGSGLAQVRKFTGLAPAEAAAFFSAWRKRQWDLLLLYNSIGCFASYNVLTKEALIWAAQQQGLELDTELTHKLTGIWLNFTPWPEAAESIGFIRAKGYAVAMLSNGDRVMLDALAQTTGLCFDYIFAAEDAGCYKPCPVIYRLPQSLGLAQGEYLHVAGSGFDVMGAVAAGLPCVWVNRKQEPPLGADFSPLHQISALNELVELLP